MRKFKCSCGKRVTKIRYRNGKSECDQCAPISLSGTFLRRMDMERQTYAKDILQKYNKDGSVNKDFEEAYGKGKNIG